MLPRPIRTPAAVIAGLGLALALAGPVVAIGCGASVSAADDAAGAALLCADTVRVGATADVESRAEFGTGLDGQPSWLPGPPPWVGTMLSARFIDGFAAVEAVTAEHGSADASAATGAQAHVPDAVTLPDKAAASAGAGGQAQAAANGEIDVEVNEAAEAHAQAELGVTIDAGASGQVIVLPFGQP